MKVYIIEILFPSQIPSQQIYDIYIFFPEILSNQEYRFLFEILSSKVSPSPGHQAVFSSSMPRFGHFHTHFTAFAGICVQFSC